MPPPIGKMTIAWGTTISSDYKIAAKLIVWPLSMTTQMARYHKLTSTFLLQLHWKHVECGTYRYMLNVDICWKSLKCKLSKVIISISCHTVDCLIISAVDCYITYLHECDAHSINDEKCLTKYRNPPCKWNLCAKYWNWRWNYGQNPLLVGNQCWTSKSTTEILKSK